MANDTIFALATARGRAGVAIIRISGPKAAWVAERLTGPIATPRHAYFRHVTDPETGELIDQGIILYFEGNASFTGEPVTEFQLHGSTSVVDEVLRLVGNLPGLRLARPGEFTERALLNGKMDLVEVEGLADLIDAETEEQRRQATRLMQGDLSRKSQIWKNKLLEINSLLSASIDFSDEELPKDILGSIEQDLSELAAIFVAEIAGANVGEIIRSGFVVAIIGRPNVGKSTLLNALAGRNVAIASAIAGTTRDVIEVRLNLGGFAVTLLDTAGLHETEDEIEAIGIERAVERAAQADLRVVLSDGGEGVENLGVALVDDDIIVHTKADVKKCPGMLNVSAETGEGLDQLIARINDVLAKRVSNGSSLVRQRHQMAISDALASVESARGLLADENYDIELVAEEMRDATLKLDHLVGRYDVEAVLGQIFSSFCIGK